MRAGALVVALLLAAGAPAAAAPEGEMTWATRAPVGADPYGARVEEPGFGVIAGYPFTAPYEEIRLRRGRP